MVPRVIASTALRRPARMAGPIAATSGDPEGDEGHRDQDQRRHRERWPAGRTPGSSCATVGWLAIAPATTPSAVPRAAGARIWTRSMPLTWPGVKPTAFMTPMSR